MPGPSVAATRARAVGALVVVLGSLAVCAHVAGLVALSVIAAALLLTAVVAALGAPAPAAARLTRVSTRTIPTFLGWVAIVMALDWGAGALAGSFSSDEEDDRPVATEVEGQIPLDPRADGEAMAAYPWSDEYFEELGRLEYEYAPYVTGRLGTYEGEYINTTPDGRASYVPPQAERGDAVDVWFLGGSTMFGEGQRDEYTIPSYVARLAEADGLPVRPHNLAQQGLVGWQELLIFERELARRPAPDVVVFYDGTNDFNAQLENPDDDPVHYDEADYARNIGPDGLALPEGATVPDATVWQEYVESSVLHRLFGIDAAAAGTDGIEEVTEPEAVIDDTRQVYLRMVDLASFLAGTNGVEPFFFWQPVQSVPGDPYRVLAGTFPPPVHDISGVLDDPPAPVFIDGGHTNELGAELVAEAIYRRIRPALLGAAPP